MAAGADGRGFDLDERFRQALDSILDLVVVERAIRDATGAIVDFEIVWMNTAPVDAAGRSRDQLIGRRISELYPSLAGGELVAGYARVVETWEPLVVPVMPYEDVIDGRPVSGFYTVQATKFEDGVLIASRDITQLETSRLELEVALRELEAAQRLAGLGTWRVDLATQLVTLSGESQRIFALAPDASGAMSMTDLAKMIHPADFPGLTRAFEQAIATGIPAVFEHRVIRADGSVLHVRSYTEPVLSGGDVVGLSGTTQDISDTVASRAALDAEHVRRVSAEALADLASALNGARSAQVIIDAVHESGNRVGTYAAAFVGILEPDEPILRQYFGAGILPREMQARYMRTPLDVDTYLTRAVNTGEPLFLLDRAAQLREFPALAKDIESTTLESAAVVPLRRASGGVFGALAIGWQRSHGYDAATAAALTDMAVVVARAIEQLELLELERSIARALQLGLLALDVRSTQAIVRARYQSSDATMEIGGDWYDAVELDDGRIAVAVGDVVGRGLSAATTMGQLRAALGVTAMQADDAADAITILDQYAKHVPGASCTTVAFAVIDPASATVSHASAGHPPPLLVTPDGTVKYLEGGRSWPLGIDTPRRRPPAATEALPPGALLLLFTDGLVERRGESLDVGLERLRSIVAEHWNLPLRRLKQAIFRGMVDKAELVATDDIALVAVRTVGASPSLFVDIVHSIPSEAKTTRHRLRAWLEGIGMAPEPRDALLLAVGEAVANAIDHGSQRDESLTVKIEVARRAGHMVASVSDSGRWLPGIGGFFAGRGRGHLLMQGLTDDVGIETDQQGTIVTLEMSLPSESQ
jgi:PAS domain-containing protein/anti-sigma regulatory factor (Ser/Thr protein kinase)